MNKTDEINRQVKDAFSKAKSKGGNSIELVNSGNGDTFTLNQYNTQDYESIIKDLEKDRSDARQVIEEMKTVIESLNETIGIITKNLYSKDDLVQAKDELIKTLREEIIEKDKIIDAAK